MTSQEISRDYLGKVELRLDPPRRHDAAPLLLRHLDRLPAAWRAAAGHIRETSERLFEERGHAFYGDEDELLPPSELFTRAEAEEAIAAVEMLLGLYPRPAADGGAGLNRSAIALLETST